MSIQPSASLLSGEFDRTGSALEAPPPTPSLFTMEGIDSATLETVTLRREADGRADAGDRRRQQARREMRGERIPLTTD